MGSRTRDSRMAARLGRIVYSKQVHHLGCPSEVKTPLDIYLQRHSPLSPDLWLHYSRLSARYTGRHVPGADISLYPISSYFRLDTCRANRQHAISTGMCPELIFPYIPYLLTYPSGLSPALSSRRKNTVTGVNLK